MSPSTLKLKLILLALCFFLPSLLAVPVPVPQIEFEVGGLVEGLTRGGLEGERVKRDPSPQLDFEVGGYPVGLTRGGLAGEKEKRQIDFEVGGFVEGLTRGGLEGEKRNASPEAVPQS